MAIAIKYSKNANQLNAEIGDEKRYYVIIDYVIDNRSFNAKSWGTLPIEAAFKIL